MIEVLHPEFKKNSQNSINTRQLIKMDNNLGTHVSKKVGSKANIQTKDAQPHMSVNNANENNKEMPL